LNQQIYQKALFKFRRQRSFFMLYRQFKIEGRGIRVELSIMQRLEQFPTCRQRESHLQWLWEIKKNQILIHLKNLSTQWANFCWYW
jgi:hypothetical protein